MTAKRVHPATDEARANAATAAPTHQRQRVACRGGLTFRLGRHELRSVARRDLVDWRTATTIDYEDELFEPVAARRP
jgi:hypothetical protein